MEAEKKVIPMVRVISTCIKYKLFSRGSDDQFARFVKQCDKGIDLETCKTTLESVSSVPDNILNSATNELFAN